MLFRSRWPTFLLAPSYLANSVSLVLTEVEFVAGTRVSLDRVIVRLRGNDHLVYHGLAREMLDSGFLRGGEDVFHFQPGIRYVLFLQQTVLGESGVLTGIASVFALALGILAVADRLQSKHAIDKLAQVIGVISLVFGGHPHIQRNRRFSGYPSSVRGSCSLGVFRSCCDL